MPPPSLSRKLRTQPTRSDGQLLSMRDSAMDGCHFGKPLKSRINAQMASAGASMTLEV
jgi:hypothetical protein